MSQAESNVVVSVIMTTYNHEAYIKKAIDSVLCQETNFVFELIIGNDASTDKTSQIIQSISADNSEIIRLIDRRENIGASANFYDMLISACGKYVAILDGDDFWVCRDKLQKQVDFLEEHKDYIGCTHSCKLVDNEGRLVKTPEPDWIFRGITYGLNDFKGYRLPGQPSTMLFRNIFSSSEHDYSIIKNAHRLIADRTLTVCLAVNGMFRRFEDPMSCYRINHSSSATTVLYENNSDECGFIDIDLSKKIETYLWQEFGVKKRFVIYRLKIRIKYCIKKIIPDRLLKYIKSHK
mgnify:CR=1 FL=1